MSSKQVRDIFKEFLDDNSNETVVDLTDAFAELDQLLSESGVQPDAPWLGLEFNADSETAISLSATNDKGLYREYGSIVLHVCTEAKIGAGNTILTRGESLLNLFRGRNIEGIVIEEMVPINTGQGATLDFDGGYVAGSITLGYHFDISPQEL